jgi:hypothetical protein
MQIEMLLLGILKICWGVILLVRAYGKELPNGKDKIPCNEVLFTIRFRA